MDVIRISGSISLQLIATLWSLLKIKMETLLVVLNGLDQPTDGQLDYLITLIANAM